MSVSRLVRGLSGTLVLLLLGASACSDAPAEQASWPMSEIEQPDTSAVLADPGIADTEVVAETRDAAEDAAPQVQTAAAGPAPRPYSPPTWMSSTGLVTEPDSTPLDDFPDARFPRPEHVRGLYVNAWAAGSSRRMDELIEIAEETEINSFVIDIKDATGFLSHETDLELAREIGADGEIRIRDLPGLLDRLEAAGIYPIARIVVVKDPLLATGRPETAVQDTAGGVWMDSKEIIWQNLFNEDLWSYNVAVAREVAEMGFPEIQWDYIRFPDAPASDYERAVFVGGEDKLRVDAVRGFLEYSREQLGDLPVRSTADVFGVTTSFRRDIGIGQLWETFIDVVDVALPMVYPSHYWEWSFGYDHPNAYPYEVVYAALRDGLRRSQLVDGAGLTRPWLQDFSLGSPAYGVAEVRAQIQATYDVGVMEWILWNPSTRYSVGALEPVGGFEVEPLVRVAGTLTPVSRRVIVMDSVAAYEQAMFDAAAALALEADTEIGSPEAASPEVDPAEGATEASPFGTIPTGWALPGAPADSRPTSDSLPVDTIVGRLR